MSVNSYTKIIVIGTIDTFSIFKNFLDNFYEVLPEKKQSRKGIPTSNSVSLTQPSGTTVKLIFLDISCFTESCDLDEPFDLKFFGAFNGILSNVLFLVKANEYEPLSAENQLMFRLYNSLNVKLNKYFVCFDVSLEEEEKFKNIFEVLLLDRGIKSPRIFCTDFNTTTCHSKYFDFEGRRFIFSSKQKKSKEKEIHCNKTVNKFDELFSQTPNVYRRISQVLYQKSINQFNLLHIFHPRLISVFAFFLFFLVFIFTIKFSTYYFTAFVIAFLSTLSVLNQDPIVEAILDQTIEKLALLK